MKAWSITAHAMRQMRRGMIGWMCGLAMLAGWMIALYPTIRDNDSMSQLVASYPPAVRNLFNLDDFTTGVGYLRAEVFSFVLPLLLTIAAAFWGADAIAGEEEDGTLDLLLTHPISRRRIVLEKAMAMSSAVMLTTLAMALVLFPGTKIVRLDVATSHLAATLVACALLALTYGALALAVGAATGRTGVARGATIVAVVASYLISALAGLVPWLRNLRPLSPWFHALGVDPLHSGFRYLHLLALAIGSVVLVAAACELLERREPA